MGGLGIREGVDVGSKDPRTRVGLNEGENVGLDEAVGNGAR